ncbi:hypothetical protein [Staphylococcus gallinarum]|uniref:hypothetical protein n=1 Tax=Staphylococcus gallinarum TaxID=1293 RepID=UPI002442052E|nr:hypothetical protein [Staphylococcus gallinarum]
MAHDKKKPNNAIGCIGALVIAVIVVIIVLITSLFGGDDSKKETNNEDNKVTVSKNASPKEKLSANIKNSIGKNHFKSIKLNESEDKIIIFLKDYDGVTNKNRIKSMDTGIVKSLLELKKSDINVSDIEVTVMQKVETQKMKEIEAVQLRTKWDAETVRNLNSENKSNVMNNTKDYAEEYHLNKNIK